MIVLTRHAEQRMGQRHITLRDLELVMQFGRELRAAGTIFFFFGRKEIPEQLRSDSKVTRLEGTVVVVSSDGAAIITTYKNREGICDIRRKHKRYHPKAMAA